LTITAIYKFIYLFTYLLIVYLRHAFCRNSLWECGGEEAASDGNKEKGNKKE